MNDLTLGQKIRKFRKRAELSQMELELEIGASPGSISRIENGQVNPTKETLYTISNILHLTSKETMEIYGIKPKNESFPDYLKMSRMIFKFAGRGTPRLNSIHLAQTLMEQMENKFHFGGFSISEIGKDFIRLHYIFNTLMGKFLKEFYLGKNIYFKIPLEDTGLTYTIKASVENKIVIEKNLEEFIAPPLDKISSRIIQKVGNIGSMAAIPIALNNKVICTFNIAFKDDLETLRKNYKGLEQFKSEVEKMIE